MRAVSYQILDEIKATLKQLDERSLFSLADKIVDADRIFVVGSGRCDIIMRSFAMRTSQLAITTHVVRDVTTPAIGKDDLLIICTLSPDNKGLIDIAKHAYMAHAQTALISPNNSSAIADIVNLSLVVPKALTPSGLPSMQPGGVIFEQCCFIITETLIQHISARLNRSNEMLMKNKANLE